MRAPCAGLVVAVGLAVGACGSSSGATSGCGDVIAERLDPAAFVHQLPGGPEPTYLSDPPTSGPHDPRPVDPVLDEPLTRPRQVGQLEAGKVLIQWRDLAAADQAAVEALAGDEVVVAPNPDLPSPVVATAWTLKMTCTAVDTEALAGFAADHAGHGPGGPAH